MFFILSKLLLFLISPAFWIIILLSWSFITKRENVKKWFRITSLVVFILFSNPYLFNVLVRTWQPKAHSVTGKSYSAAILLGGIAKFDRLNNGFFSEDADRFIQTTKLYHTGVVKKIAVCGGSPTLFKKNHYEANYLNYELQGQGIPSSDIIIENKSRNTYENAVFIKQKLDSLQLSPPYLLISSAIHLPRAVAVFKKTGIEVVPYPSAFKEVDKRITFADFIPSIKILSDWTPFLKEIIGLVVYRITGKA